MHLDTDLIVSELPGVSHKAAILDHLDDLYDKLQNHQISKDDVCKSNSFKEIQENLMAVRMKLKHNKTSALWFQYMDMVLIIQQFIRAERTRDWIFRLKTLKEMLPYFAASGHNLYLKSAHIYLQKMMKLEEVNPDVYQQFLNGFHCIKRSDRYWAGLSTDLTIEQVLMKSLKTSGG